MSFSKASDCLFHPPGGSPFGKSADNLHSNYHPSPANEVLNKKLTLTPERVTRRSEYALPPEKYTPEQYSFIKDDHISLDESYITEPTKLPPPPPVPKINWTASGIETLPSTDVTDPTFLSTPRYISVPKQAVVPVKIKTTFAENSQMSTSPLSQRLHQFRFGEPKPRSARTKMKESLERRRGSINNKSNVSKASINQSKASKASTKNQSNMSNLKQVKKSPHKTAVAPKSNKDRASPLLKKDDMVYSHSTTAPDNNIKSQSLPSLSHSLEDDESCESLHSRLSLLLQETESVLSTSGEDVLTTRSSIPSSSAETTMCNRFNAYKRSPPPTSRPRTAPLNLPERLSTAKPQSINERHETTRRPHLEAEDAGVNLSESSVPQEDDILFQWRLRRKMNAARKAAEEKNRNEYRNFMQQDPVPIPIIATQQQRCTSTAERPYDRNIITHERTSETRPSHSCCVQTQMKHASAAAVPLTSSQTQTSKSLDEAWSDNSTELQDHEPDAIQATRSSDESTVSFHKVTVVKADSSPQAMHATHALVSPKSTKTSKTDTSVWSSNDAKQLHQTERTTSTSNHSPAGTAVKNVIGMRLFETPSSVGTKHSVAKTTPVSKQHEEVSSEEFNDSYNTILDLPKKKLPDDTSEDKVQHEQQNDVASHASVIDQVLEELENGIVDFPDDPVMQTLREQRLKYLQELGSIEEILVGWKS